jgi:hypothetical protein
MKLLAGMVLDLPATDSRRCDLGSFAFLLIHSTQTWIPGNRQSFISNLSAVSWLDYSVIKIAFSLFSLQCSLVMCDLARKFLKD